MNTLKVWDGTKFVMGSLKAWNGSAYVTPKSMHTWDGTKVTRPGSVGVLVKGSEQPIESTAESDKDGATTSKSRLRLVGYPDLLGAQTAVEWQGRRYAIDGDARIYNGSRRTAHVDYVMVRR